MLHGISSSLVTTGSSGCGLDAEGSVAELGEEVAGVLEATAEEVDGGEEHAGHGLGKARVLLRFQSNKQR